MKLLLSGCTGFIGKELIKQLKAKNFSLIILSRNPDKYSYLKDKNTTVSYWDGTSIDSILNPIEDTDAIINLAGEPIVNKRWSKTQKELILTSRIKPTQTIVKALSQANKKSKVLINASAVGYYGDTKSNNIDENYKKGVGFLSDICAKWENEALKAQDYGIRVVILRTGIVLEKDGGALNKMLLPFNFFTGGPLGSGNQWFPWIHRDDVVNIILYSLNNNTSGPINVIAPNPVTMESFCKTLGRVLNRPSWLPVPDLALKLLLGEMSEMILTGQKAFPKKLLNSNYKFIYPELEGALKTILK